jgi:hypothetical protein
MQCCGSGSDPEFGNERILLMILKIILIWLNTRRILLCGIQLTHVESYCGSTVKMVERFQRGGIIQGVLLYTMTPWKTPRKFMGEWDYRTRIIPLLSSMKPGRCFHAKVFIFMRPKHVWRSRTPDVVRCAHFPSVITTRMDHKVQLLNPLNLGELYTA